MLSRILAIAGLAVPGMLHAAPEPATSDTAAFLQADNWQGLKSAEVSWTIDPKARTITGETKENPKFNTFFCSKESYGDFELTCKAKLTGPTANSGIQIRSEIVDKEKFVVAGPQADMGALYWGGLYGERVGGMMHAAPTDKVKKVLKADDWNDYYLLVKGNHVTIKVNGETMTDEDFPTLPDKKTNLPMAKTGIIAWQLHAGQPMKAEFKEIAFAKK